MLALIQDLYRHMEWADARQWRALLAHGPAREDPELKERFLHIHAVQQIWMARWQGLEIPVPQVSDYAAMADLNHFAKACHAALRVFISLQSDATLPRDIAYRNIHGDAFTQPLGDLMLHLAFHGQYHRGQTATRMRTLGSAMPGTDLVVWQREGRMGAEWNS